MNSRAKNTLIAVLCLALLVALISTVVLGNIQNNRKAQELEKKAQQTNTVVVTSTNQEENEIINPYEKIKNKKATSIVILGDYIAQSEGVEEKNKWSTIVSSSIEKDYGIKPSVEFETNKDQGIVKTLENYNKNKAAKKYDFAIVCVGADDEGVLKVEQFRQNYETLVRKIKEGNENCEVILLIESAIRTEKTFPEAIKSIGDFYELPSIDARDVFNKSNFAYNKLTTQDMMTPSIDGYKLYSDAVYNLIKTNIEKGREVKALKKELLYNN